MAEILVKAVDATHPDPEIDRRGCYKRGMIVEVREDGAPRGKAESLPLFVWILVPGIPVKTIQKYMQPENTPNPEMSHTVYRRRRWQIRWSSLPAAARNKLQNTGQLIIKAGGYSGAHDYTWAQVRGYFRDLQTGLDEAGDI